MCEDIYEENGVPRSPGRMQFQCFWKPPLPNCTAKIAILANELNSQTSIQVPGISVEIIPNNSMAKIVTFARQKMTLRCLAECKPHLPPYLRNARRPRLIMLSASKFIYSNWLITVKFPSECQCNILKCKQPTNLLQVSVDYGITILSI